MKRFIAAVSVFAMFFNIIPLNSVSAAVNGDVGIIDAFKLTANNYSLVLNQPTAPGSFAGGSLQDYPEGSCIPFVFAITNDSGFTDDTRAYPVFDYFDDVVGVERLELLSANVAVPTNLNQFNFTNTAYDAADNVALTTTLGSPVTLQVDGPYAGNNTSTTATGSTDEFRHYNVTVEDVPDGETVNLSFCARLSLGAGGFNGASMGVRNGGPGGEKNTGINPDKLLELPEVNVIKVVSGGTAVAGDFTINMTATNPSLANFPGSATGTVVTFDPGFYSLVESAVPNYLDTYSAGCTGTLAYDAPQATCTVTNTFVPTDTTGTLFIDKVLVNAPVGVEQNDFSFDMIIDGNSTGVYPFLNFPNVSSAEGLNEGTTFEVVESPAPFDYDVTYDGCTGVIDGDVDSYCTVTNTYNPGNVDLSATLTINKIVAGINLPVNEFTYVMHVDGQPDPFAVQFQEGGTEVVLQEGDSFEVRETDYQDYVESESGDCEGVVVAGQDMVCTITNTYIPEGTITVIKYLPNDDGGVEEVTDFVLFLNGDSVDSGAVNVLPPDTYTLSEDWDNSHYNFFPETHSVDEWYDVSYSCVDGNTVTTSPVVTLEDGHDIVCTITNDDKPATITINKVLPNNDGGLEEITDFVFALNAVPVMEGEANEVAAGTYTLTEEWFNEHLGEVISDRYTVSYSSNCANGSITVGLGEQAVCTITNDDKEAQITVIKQVVGGPVNGPQLTANDFSMTVTGDVSGFAQFNGDEDGTVVGLNAQGFEVGEVANPDYVATYEGFCGEEDLVPGQQAVCTVTNTYDPILPATGRILLMKDVVGSNAADDDFNYILTINSDETAPVAFDPSGTTVLDFPAGTTYTIVEESVDGYTATYSETGCAGTIVADTVVECTVTNTVIAPPDAFIQGLFYSDTDGNGRNNEGAATRINGLTVTLYDSSFVELDSMTTGLPSLTSGSLITGQYRFRNLAAGTYHVCSQDMNASLFDQTSPENGFKDPLLNSSPNVISEVDPAISGQYCYQVSLVDDQHQIYVRFGFEPVEQLPPACVPGNLVANGSFESPVVTNPSLWDNFIDGTFGLFWRSDAVDDSTASGLEIQAGYAGWTPADGNQFAELDGNEPNQISQTLDTVPGIEYTLSFEFSARPETVAANNAVEVYWQGNSLGTIVASTDLSGNTSWSTHEFTVTAFGETADITFVDRGVTPDSLGTFIDNVSVDCGAQVATGELTVTKVVVNSDAAFTDFTYFLTLDDADPAHQAFDEDGVTVFTLPIGTSFTVVEQDHGTAWDATYSGCTGVITVDGASCTITNTFEDDTVRITDPVIPTLACVESVGEGMLSAHFGYDNQNEGSVFLEAGEIENRMNGGGLLDQDQGQPSTFAVGANPDNFEVVFDGAIPLIWTLISDDTRSVQADANSELCGDDEPNPTTITLEKILIQDNGAVDELSNFEFFIDGSEVQLGVATEVTPGVAHVITEGYDVAPTEGEEVSDRYVATFSPECLEGSATLEAGEDVVCTITNNDLMGEMFDGSLTFNVIVNGGDATPAGFNLYLDGDNVTAHHDDDSLIMPPGDYTLFQEPRTGYEAVFSGDCSGTGIDNAAGNIASDEDAVCTITNTFVGGPGGNGGNSGGGSNGGGGNGGSNDDDSTPPGEVLGDSDEQDESEDEVNVDEEVVIAPPPIVAGDSDELPRTGVPIAGVLALGSVLTFLARRKEQK